MSFGRSSDLSRVRSRTFRGVARSCGPRRIVPTRRRVWPALAVLWAAWSTLALVGLALRLAASGTGADPLPPGPGPASGPVAGPWLSAAATIATGIGTAIATGIEQGDARFAQALQDSVLLQPGPRHALAIVSRAGDGPVMTLVCCAAAVLLWRIGARGWAWRLPLAAAVHGGLIRLCKAWVDRPRPAHQDDGWVLVSGASFPSGHAAGGLFLYGLFALLTVSLAGRDQGPEAATGRGRLHPWRRCVAIAWLVLGLSTGLTRPLLQLHHPSDVVAGWLLALGMLALVWLMRPVARCPTA